jgi:hypothetical protein
MDSLSWDMRARRPGVAEAEDDVLAEDKVGGLSEYEDGGEVVVE